MITLDASEVAIIQNRYPEVFKGRRLKRAAPLLVVFSVALYFVYVWSFFNMSDVLERAKWDIAGAYLADWISYETRPDIAFHDTWLDVSFPNFDPLGKDPHPDWLKTESATVTKTIETAAPAITSGGATQNSGFLGALPGTGTQSGEESTSGASMGFMGSGGMVGAAETETETEIQTVTEDAVISASVEQGGAIVDIVPGFVTVHKDGLTYEFDASPDTGVVPRQTLPDWMTQKEKAGKVFVWLGFDGRIEIEDDEVKIRHRFLGWENFLFDVNSPFWGKSFGEVMGLIVSGEEIRPGRSNLQLAFDNILNNAEWQHGDVWTKLLQTVVMAFMGTLLASMLAFPLSFVAARNITPNRVVNWSMKRFFDFTRSVDMLIWALFFTRAFGPGPLAGISAIFFTDTGTFGKLFSESLENIDDKQREGVRSVGASPLLVQRFGIIPQVLPVFISQTLYFWESNTRSATIIGAVGAGGIGLKLWESMRTNSDWENVAYMVVLILIVVFIFDNISNFLRSRLIGGAMRTG